MKAVEPQIGITFLSFFLRKKMMMMMMMMAPGWFHPLLRIPHHQTITPVFYVRPRGRGRGGGRPEGQGRKELNQPQPRAGERAIPGKDGRDGERAGELTHVISRVQFEIVRGIAGFLPSVHIILQFSKRGHFRDGRLRSGRGK